MVHTVVVRGTPRSIQSSSRSKTARKRIVANEASRAFNSPLVDDGLKITITIFYNGFPTWDPNNMAKPICDAMNGIAYIDDNQVTDHFVKKRPLDGSYRIKGIPLEVAVAMAEGNDFVWIEISILNQNEVENL